MKKSRITIAFSLCAMVVVIATVFLYRRFHHRPRILVDRPKDSWHFAGYATPEDAFESLTYASGMGDVKGFLAAKSGMSFSQQVDLEDQWKDLPEQYRIQNMGLGKVTGYRILEEQVIAPDEIKLRVLLYSEGRNREIKRSIRKIGNEWKEDEGQTRVRMAGASPQPQSGGQPARSAPLDPGSPSDRSDGDGTYLAVDRTEMASALGDKILAADSQGNASGTNLSSMQKEKLVAITREFFRTYGNANLTFDEYLAFKTGSRKYHFDFTGMVARIISDHPDVFAFPAEASELDKARHFWEGMAHNNSNPGGPAYPVIISADPASITVSINPKGYDAWSSGRPLRLIVYDDSLEAIAARNGAIVYAEVKAVCRFSTSPDPEKMYVCFYWSDAENEWMPWEFKAWPPARFEALF